jgi:butyryl-CoA dehydrogenase
MDFQLSQEHTIFQKAIRDFCDKEIAPIVDEYEEREEFPVHLFPKMAELGFLCVRWPEEYGAAGADKITEIILVEELCRACSGIGGGIMVHNGLATAPILYFGSEEQKQKYLVPAIKGEKIGAFGLTEPDAGSDAASMKTRAVKDGDDYVINGAKTFITNGGICDYVVLAAYTNPEKRGEGVNLFLVDKGTPGFSVGRKIRKVGNHTSDTAELIFEDCRVHKSQMIGEKEGGGFGQLIDTLRSGRVTYGARCSGLAMAAVEMSIEYGKQRVQFRKPIIKFQAIRFKIAEMVMNMEAMRTLTFRAASLEDQGVKSMKEAAMVKLFCTETLQKIVSEAMHVHGGYGYTMEYPIQRIWRDAKLLTITEGTSEVQKMLIARESGF